MNTVATLQSDVLTLRLCETYAGDAVQLPFYYYDIFTVAQAHVGKISLRIGNNAQSCFNGHIGYEIELPHRGHGYALQACRLVLPIARAHGMQELFLTCAQSNIASRKTIERLGAQLLRVTQIPQSCFFWQPGIEPYCIYTVNL